MRNRPWLSIKHILEDCFVIEHQYPQILEQIERGELHPVMLAYGLWKDQEDLATLVDEITVNRQTQASRPALEL